MNFIFGEIIRELRKDKNLTQKELANILDVTNGTISNYEKEEHEPSIEALKKLADYFEVSIDYIIGRIRFNFDYSIMNKNIEGQYTVSDLLNDILDLSMHDTKMVVEYVNLLKIRNNKII